MVMAVIGTSIITAVGLMGALAIIRFRNIIKDTRDIAFIFCSLVVGMAAGSQRYAVAIVGTIILSLIVIYLYLTSFGTHQPHLLLEVILDPIAQFLLFLDVSAVILHSYRRRTAVLAPLKLNTPIS
jgi:hypothetical protein